MPLYDALRDLEKQLDNGEFSSGKQYIKAVESAVRKFADSPEWKREEEAERRSAGDELDEIEKRIATANVDLPIQFM